MMTTLGIPDSVYREFKVKTATSEMPEWAGIAEPFITRFPDDPLDAEKMRDDIVAFRRGADE